MTDPPTIEAKPPYRILVTGARKITMEQFMTVTATLNRFLPFVGARTFVVIEGEAPHDRVKCDGQACEHLSVDLAARGWGEHQGLQGEVEPYPGDWKTHGVKAGPIRNAAMVASGADICLAFPGNKSVGTWQCLRIAAEAGIIGRVYPLGDTPS